MICLFCLNKIKAVNVLLRSVYTVHMHIQYDHIIETVFIRVQDYEFVIYYLK